jgi:hypothetical protein
MTLNITPTLWILRDVPATDKPQLNDVSKKETWIVLVLDSECPYHDPISRCGKMRIFPMLILSLITRRPWFMDARPIPNILSVFNLVIALARGIIAWRVRPDL